MTGIVERIKSAKTKAKRDKLLKEAESYEYINDKTLRRCRKYAKGGKK